MGHTHDHSGGGFHRAGAYDLTTRVFGHGLRALHRAMLARARIAPGERVIDVGCGPGRLTLLAAEAAGPTGEVLGVDLAPEMVALATHHAEQVGSRAVFREAGIDALPAPDGPFDVALASLMLHHLDPELQRRGLAEVHRVTKPGGRLIVGEFRAEPGHGAGHVLTLLGLRRGASHADRLRALVEASGFEGVEVERSGRAFCVIAARKRPP